MQDGKTGRRKPPRFFLRWHKNRNDNHPVRRRYLAACSPDGVVLMPVDSLGGTQR